jgi:hypothetical protein
MKKNKSNDGIDLNGERFFISLDVHKKSWTVTIRHANMQIEQFTQPSNCEALVNHLHQRYPGAEF